MGIAFVCGVGGLLWLAVVAAYEYVQRKAVRQSDPLDVQNAYVRAVWEEAGHNFYPHELSCGTVRWYRMSYEMDNGRTVAG
jgi:hypothetical protein